MSYRFRRAKSKASEADEACDANNYERALRLYKESIEIYPYKFGSEFVNINIKLIECCLFLGNIDEAENELKRLECTNFNEKDHLKEQCEKLRRINNTVTEMYNAVDVKNAESLSKELKNALIIAPGCKKYKLWQIECFCISGRYNVSFILTIKV